MIGSIAASPLALAAVPSSASAQVAHHGHHRAAHHTTHHTTHHAAHHGAHVSHHHASHAGHHQATGHHKAHHALTKAEDAALRAKILKIAASKRGTPYVYGATGPNAFDCSGFTAWVFAHLGVSLPHHAASQVGDTHIVRNPKPGDLVFFGGGGGVYHVAIYAGHGEIWHAPEPGRSVTKEHLWTGNVFYGEVRGV
jgi:cell wall-associated NlpC family hydrolase